MEAFQAVLLSGLCRPGFTAIQHATEHACPVDFEFDVNFGIK